MLKYKINVMESLKNAGYSSYFMEKNKVLGSSELQKIRRDIMVGTKSINTLCKLLQCQPGDLLEYIPDSDGEQG